MARSIEIKLSLPVVSPLVEVLREFCATDDAARASGETGVLVDLFNPDFKNHGIIRVSAATGPAILRAAALLRLRLRARQLDHLTDDHLEKGLDPEQHAGDEKVAVLSYVFLASLQDVILENLPPYLGRPSSLALTWQAVKRFACRVRGKLPAVARTEPPAGTASRIIVVNDPVNLMTYVTAVFRTVLAMPEEAATRHMREVHEQRRSVVWVGPCSQADALVTALRSWHLTVAQETFNPLDQQNVGPS